MASGNALASYSGAGGMLQMMHRSESSNTDTLVAMLSSRAVAGHSAGKGVLEEGALPHQSANASPSGSNLKRPFSYPTLFETSPEETGDEDGGDDLGQPAEKKRRLTAEQVRSLEKNFEMENKLEPERKMQLARDLGLQPRQVAVWFQNRRARWKTKQLEKDYELLKADYDALKGDYSTLMEEKDRLVEEVKRLSRDKSPGRDEPVPESSNSSSESAKPSKVADPHASPSKAVAPTDAVTAATKTVPAPGASSAKPALIKSEMLTLPANDLTAKDFQLSPKSVTNFPSGNNNNSQDSRHTLGYGACGGGSPHSSDTTCNSVNSGMSNVDSPHQTGDSDYGKLLPLLQQNSPTAASTDISGAAPNWSSGSCASSGTSCGFMDSPLVVPSCSSLPPSFIVDMPFPSSMLAAMEAPFQHLEDGFDSPRLMNPGVSYVSQQRHGVKLEDGSCQQQPDELSTYFFSMDDPNSVPWWDWP